MGTIQQYLQPEEAVTLSSNFARYQRADGSSFPVTGLAFTGSGTTPQEAVWKFTPLGYGSGNVTMDVIWYAASGTSGSVAWTGCVAAITPNTDTQDVQTKTFGSAALQITNHLGTTARRLHKTTLSLSSSHIDSMAAGDECWLQVLRPPDLDTLAADAILTSVRLSYSDT
ncbi:hypothetical protein ABZW11_26570 [Nonomuraea sp. NPDC004580]|uniref:hypothetical protein n=1 Tax=Nonomuraea sp. NPDC004580 TaxID=3154552 RepID=UPI0033A4806C